MGIARVRSAAVLVSLVLLTGCGHAANRMVAPAVATVRQAEPVESKSVPPQSAFQTISGKVTKIMPDTHNSHNNLDHQNFQLVTDDGKPFTCNNDTTTGIGTKAPLQVGDHVTIRGVEYHDPGLDGIHWTHHASKPGDAGFIQTDSDGKIYQ